MSRILSLASLFLAAWRVAADDTSYQINAVCTCDQMMRWYSSSNGVWSDYWWQSANMMSGLADLSQYDPSYNGTHFSTYASTYANANQYFGYQNFIDDYYDDEGWWALAWVNVYDLTENPDYLNLAISLFNDIYNTGWSTPCGGGVWWSKDKTYIASIANELFIQLGAALANRVSSDEKDTYLNPAIAGWDWFWNIGVVGSDNFVVDGVDNETCQPTGDVYSYNQGVILGAAVELYSATGNATYLSQASDIANAVTVPNSQLTNANNILEDGCDRTDSCSGDGEEFKGPFIKNLRKLQLATPSQQWLDFIVTNAQSIWTNDLNDTSSQCYVGDYWVGPYVTADASSNSVGLDALVAAYAVTT